MVPVPRAPVWEELNAQLLEQSGRGVSGSCGDTAKRSPSGSSGDKQKLLPLARAPLEACQKRTTSANSQALVRYETNDYSVPVEYGHGQVLLKAFVWEIVISC